MPGYDIVIADILFFAQVIWLEGRRTWIDLYTEKERDRPSEKIHSRYITGGEDVGCDKTFIEFYNLIEMPNLTITKSFRILKIG